jgi:hypothetical protein
LELRTGLHNSEALVKKLEDKALAQTRQLEQLKSMFSALGLDSKQFSKSKRENNSTTKAMISDPSSSTYYRRRKISEKHSDLFVEVIVGHTSVHGIILWAMHQ